MILDYNFDTLLHNSVLLSLQCMEISLKQTNGVTLLDIDTMRLIYSSLLTRH